MASMARKDHLTRRRFLAATAAVVCGTPLVGAFESKDVCLTRKTLKLPRWDANGFRIAQLSDIHVNSEADAIRARKAMRMAIAEKPDLIVLTGDFLNEATENHFEHVTVALEPLHDFRAPSICVFGNHDWGCGETEKLAATIAESPMRLLQNDSTEIGGVTIVGLDDALFDKQRPDAINQHGSSKSLLVLFHEPDFVTELPSYSSLMLSGHSHGGEICFPNGRPLHTPEGAKRYVAGFYPDAHVPLYVSRGIGTLGPGRVFCPPEVVLLTLESA